MRPVCIVELEERRAEPGLAQFAAKPFERAHCVLESSESLLQASLACEAGANARVDRGQEGGVLGPLGEGPGLVESRQSQGRIGSRQSQPRAPDEKPHLGVPGTGGPGVFEPTSKRGFRERQSASPTVHRCYESSHDRSRVMGLVTPLLRLGVSSELEEKPVEETQRLRTVSECRVEVVPHVCHFGLAGGEVRRPEEDLVQVT